MAQTGAAGVLLGPLTTTWTMPQTCSIFMPGCSTCNNAYNGQSCNPTSGGRVQDNTACWPPVTRGVSSPDWPFVGWGFYSPGLACPAGYTSACTAVYGQRPPWETQFSLVSSETAVGCCPPGFTCANVNGNTCTRTITSSSTFQTAFCSDTDLVDFAVATFPSVAMVTTTETNTQTTDVESGTSTITMVLFAPMFQLNFQASDLPASSTASSTASNTSTRSSSASASETGSGNGTSSKSSSGGLSSGAKIGLGVGIGLGVAFLLAFGAFIYYYRRSRNNAVPLGSELPNNQISVEAPQTPKVKQSPGQIYEMGVYHAPVELPGNVIQGGYQDSPPASQAHRYA